jgi:hypothetical protein
MNDDRPFSGKCAVQPGFDADELENSATPHPLVEEAIPISLAALRKLYGRAALLKAAENAEPVGVQIAGNVFSIYLLAEPHRLPHRGGRLSDKESRRLWIVCYSCRRKVRKLFTYPNFQGSSVLYMPLCRSCHGLVYQSQNCGGNKWWREIARPFKRLLQRRESLLAGRQSPAIGGKLDLLEQSINLLRQRAAPKTRSKHLNADLEPGHASGVKRRYRDLGPILQSLPC